ncbi:MAG: redoxin domain-containing protein [Candidatus Sulfopaludibacter sp.]|nr:redoxin domain-containing protein [Candidatus Sulfopaludibacter sp.]
MKALLLLLPAYLAAQTGSTDLLSGTWLNENHQTPGVTQLTVRRDGARTIVHVWGACSPVDCDWGEADAELWNGIPLVIWKHGFSDIHMELVPQPDGRLVVVYRSEYHDESGRTDAGQAEFYARQEEKPDSADTLAARALLKSVAEKYRALKTARFESTQTVHRSTGKSEIRSETSTTLFFSAPDHARVETPRSTRIEDGTVDWELFPSSNEYTRIPQAKGLSSRFLPYVLLDTVRGTPVISGHEQLDGVNCTTVRIDLGRGIRQELWIDDATRLVRKETFNDASTRRQTVYTVARTDEKLDPALFTYDPARTNATDRRQSAREAPVSLVGRPAPEFALRDLEDREVRLGDLRGKVVLLDFWGTWCGYCREALPAVELLHRAAESKGLVVFGVDSEAPALAREYVAKYKYTFRTLADPNDALAARYHVNGWPTTVLIDREGNVAFYDEGGEQEKLRDALLKLGVW